MTTLLLLLATATISWAIGNPRTLLRQADGFTVIWIVLLAAWPYIVIYTVAPILWQSAAEAGPLAPALQYMPAAVCSLIALLRGLRSPHVDVNLPALLIGTLLLFAGVSVWAAKAGLYVNFGVGAALFLGLLFRRHPVSVRQVGIGAVLGLQLIALAATVSAVFNSGATVEACREDKCGVVSQAITSPFAGNGNVLGMATTILTPFAFAALPLHRAMSVLFGVGVIQVLAGSRTAMFGLAIAAVTLVAIKVVPKLTWKLRIACLALFVSFLSSTHLLFKTFSGSTDSYRGYLWEAALSAIRQAPIFGHGPSYWWALNNTALFQANYSPHNGWLDIFVGVGLWGALTIVAAVVMIVLGCEVHARPYLIAYFATVLAIDTFESVYVPYFLGIVPFAALLPLMVYEPPTGNDPELTRNLSAVDDSTPSEDQLAPEVHDERGSETRDAKRATRV